MTTNLSKNTIKLIKSLRRKKFRQKYNKFIVEGDKMIKEILLQESFKLDQLFAVDTWLKTNESLFELQQQQVFSVSSSTLKQISELKTPNQVLAIIESPTYSLDENSLKNNVNLYLDDIQDPGNLGTIIRIADWFGISQVICSKGTVDVYNEKVIQATMGAFLRVKTPVSSLNEIQTHCPDIPIYGALMDGESIFTTSFPKSGILVIGNEGNGISMESQKLLTKRITIPAAENSVAESLNAAVATGIICSVWKNGQ